jgi:hypothetical protein
MMHAARYTLYTVILLFMTGVATAQTNVRIRATIVSINGNQMMLKTRDGQDLAVKLADDIGVAVAKPAKFEDIKDGDFLGSAAMRREDGKLVARELHYLAPTTAEGHTPWDSEPGASMTNAFVKSIVSSTSGKEREVTMTYKGGSQTIVVPEGTPIGRTVPGSRADLIPGEYVFMAARKEADGSTTALRIQVSKDGFRPPQ